MRTPYVSIHFNSGSPIANGAEVWYANSSSYNYGTHTQGRTLSNAIQKQLTSLGLADRGIKTRDNPYYDYPDGSTGRLLRDHPPVPRTRT